MKFFNNCCQSRRFLRNTLRCSLFGSIDVVDNAVQIHGGRGYMRDFAVERLYRELRVDRVWEGTSEIQRLIIARELMFRNK